MLDGPGGRIACRRSSRSRGAGPADSVAESAADRTKKTAGQTMTSRVGVLGIGNAIVDVIARVDDQFLADIRAEKRSMTLIDEDRAIEVYQMMGPAVEMSGGSVANTIAGLASLSGQGGIHRSCRQRSAGSHLHPDLPVAWRRCPFATVRWRCVDGAQPHPDHTGRTADHADLSRSLRRVGGGRGERAHHRRPRGSSSSKGMPGTSSRAPSSPEKR